MDRSSTRIPLTLLILHSPTFLGSTLLIGGDTVTTAVARVFWILAREQEAQSRLRSEIRKAKLAVASEQGLEGEWEGVSLPYDTLVSLPYLDAVVRETLRLFPPTSLINRVCVALFLLCCTRMKREIECPAAVLGRPRT